MGENEDRIYRIICRDNMDYSLAIRGGDVVFALINPFDRYQHWIKDERHGATKKDCEGHLAFALVNRATGQAISHCPTDEPVPLVRYDVNSCDKSVLWTMSEDVYYEVFRNIHMVDDISVCFHTRGSFIHDGHLLGLSVPNDIFENAKYHWKFENISPSTCISLFRPSQHTIKIICRVKGDYNLAIDKDGRTVLLVPSNPKDPYQHWIKETAYGVPVKDVEGNKAFALVNKATGKAIKQGFGQKYLVQVAPFNRDYMDPSLLWTESNIEYNFRNITTPNKYMAFTIFDKGVGKCPLLGLAEFTDEISQKWKIEDIE